MQETTASGEYFIRPRINILLTQAIKKPLTILCAGMGYGKTRAVYDFTQTCGIPVAWTQFSKADNNGPRLWEGFVRAIAKINKPLAGELKKLGFPDTEDKLNMYFNVRTPKLKGVPCLFVFDDFHLVKDAAILRFMERAINSLAENTSVILITRELPQINISSLMMRDNIYIINEAELNFTVTELSQYFFEQGLSAEISNLEKIYHDTNGWIFLIRFVIRMLKKTPGYLGYASDAIKYDVLQLIEMEVWNIISERLRRFLLCLSLINHYSDDLIGILLEKDESLTAELKQQNAFIRFNNHMGSWHIHPLFLDFLYTKQNFLSDNEMHKTYKTVADWCEKNNFIIDAIFYYEKIGDYQSIISILYASSSKFFMDNARHIIEVFNRAPDEIYDQVEFSAAIHIQLVMNLGQWQETLGLIQRYEQKYLGFPEANAFRNRMLGYVYYYWAILRMILCTTDGLYDFDSYFAKMRGYLREYPINPACWYQHPPGLWSGLAGCARTGAPQKYLDALTRSVEYISDCVNGLSAGIDNLCQGELFFYQGNIREAEPHINKALEKGRAHGQHEIVCRALFYIMRIAVFQGDFVKAESMLKETEKLLEQSNYSIRFFTYDIVAGWYYCVLCQTEKIPGWLKETFIVRLYANTLESFSNCIKARYCFLTKNYSSLLSYIEEQRRLETILYGRIELLVLEACVRYKMNDKTAAFEVLREAYETAAPNDIIMPFLELGKDMRTLLNAAVSGSDCGIPRVWLESVRKTASTYARNQALVISDYIKKSGLGGKITLSPREKEVLRDMYEGLSNKEIAAKYGLSVNTIKMHIGYIYNKLGARKKIDIFRAANEYNLL